MSRRRFVRCMRRSANRRMSAAPSNACAAAPAAIATATARSASGTVSAQPPVTVSIATSSDPRKTPGQSADPKTVRPASASPAAGQTTEAYPGGSTKSSPSVPANA